MPHLSEYQTLIVDYQQYLSDYSPRSIRLEKFVRKLILIYQITEKDILIGHSMGENTAAALAGVMSFEDCIGLVLLRGQLFDSVPAGGMMFGPSGPTRSAPPCSLQNGESRSSAALASSGAARARPRDTPAG